MLVVINYPLESAKANGNHQVLLLLYQTYDNKILTRLNARFIFTIYSILIFTELYGHHSDLLVFQICAMGADSITSLNNYYTAV